MKTTDENKTNLTLIDELREIRNKMSLEMQDMTLAQIKDYLKEKETLHPPAVWQKANQRNLKHENISTKHT